jgi:hypothetical protein
MGVSPATCPVRLLESWLEQSAIFHGPNFRLIRNNGVILAVALSDLGIACVVRRWVDRAGFDARAFGGHSLRTGLATSAAMAGKPERIIMVYHDAFSVSLLFLILTAIYSTSMLGRISRAFFLGKVSIQSHSCPIRST